jgi:tRNA pseudouridine38-40 synthase
VGKPVSIVAFWLSYRGENFHGYQAQGELRTVQSEVLRAFQEAGLPRNPVVGGRTDKGVSARMQVLSARVEAGTSLDDVRARLNASLPEDIRVELIKPAGERFHAAWSSSGKIYRYTLAPDAALSIDALRTAAAIFPGTHNFKTFHFKTSEERLRTVRSIDVSPRDDGSLVLTFSGDGFARHMVRMLTGAMLGFARAKFSEQTLREALTTQANFYCPVADPEPLTLWEVLYPPEVDPFTSAERATRLTD